MGRNFQYFCIDANSRTAGFRHSTQSAQQPLPPIHLSVEGEGKGLREVSLSLSIVESARLCPCIPAISCRTRHCTGACTLPSIGTGQAVRTAEGNAKKSGQRSAIPTPTPRKKIGFHIDARRVMCIYSPLAFGISKKNYL